MMPSIAIYLNNSIGLAPPFLQCDEALSPLTSGPSVQGHSILANTPYKVSRHASGINITPLLFLVPIYGSVYSSPNRVHTFP